MLILVVIGVPFTKKTKKAINYGGGVYFSDRCDLQLLQILHWLPGQERS